MSGSAVADAAALGKVQIPADAAQRLPAEASPWASPAPPSLIAPVMPPSIPAVIYAGLAAVSTGALFAASVVPGAADGVRAVRRRLPPGAPLPRHPDVGVLHAAGAETGNRVIGPLGAPVIILGGILSGASTPTEAAAVGVAYMLLLCFAYRSLTLRDLPAVLAETVITSAAVMLIVSSRVAAGLHHGPGAGSQMLSEAIFALTDNPTIFLLLVAIVMLILGTAIDPTAILVLTVPIILPISNQFGVDPIALGVLMIISNDDRAAHAAGRHGPLRAQRDHEGAHRRRCSTAPCRS